MRRAALAEIVQAAELSAADDPSNRDPHYDRTAARAALAAVPWLDPVRLAASAAHLADAEAALCWVADRAWAGGATLGDGSIGLDATGLPPEIILRLLRRALVAIAPEAAPRGDALTRLAARLATGGTATLAGVRATGGPVWRFTAAHPRR